MISEEVKSFLTKVRALRKPHLELAERLLRADEQAHWPMDLLVVSTLNRSINLLEGFSSLIEARNIVSAMPLLRVQLDCAVRLSAAWRVSNPHRFAWSVIQGTPIRKIKDRKGHPMTDRYLVNQLCASNPWVEEVYDYTSGYVHLSNQHFRNSYRSTELDSETSTLDVRVAVGDEHVADQFYVDTIHRFGLSTGLFLSYAEGWVVAKEDRDQARALAQHMKEIQDELEGGS